jgi:hypothetical protein
MLAIGDAAPDFELKDDAGQTVRLLEMLKGGPLFDSALSRSRAREQADI